MYKKNLLKNGLRLVTCDIPYMESVALGIWINVGSRYESKSNRGIAHFLEHLLFKGSEKYSCQEIKESIEGMGGVLNAFTTEEVCCYLAKLPAKYLDLALDILGDMVLHPLLPAQEVEKERGVIIEEIKMYRDSPSEYVLQLLDELLWPSQPLGTAIIGTVESVRSIRRKDLFLFKQRFYTPSDIVIAVCGRIQKEILLNKIENIFGRLNRRKKNKFSKVRQRQSKPQINILHKDTEQSHLVMGFHGLKRNHPDRYVLGLMHVLLGGNMSSRLFSELRERQGLAYEIATQVKYFADTGRFIIKAGIDNRKVKQALTVILNVLKRIKKEPISEKEFRRARDFYIGDLTLSLEDTLNHMLWIGESTATLDETYTLNDVRNEINKIRKEDLMRLARKIFREKNINLALIGPKHNQKKELYGYLKYD